MALPRLMPSADQVPVQETAFSTDALGRYLCSTWAEATGNGGAPFTAVVVGAGAYGAYCATKLFRRDDSARVLVLEAGGLLVTEHVQNLGRIGLNIPAPIPPAHDPGVARNVVWGLPWRGNVDFPGLAYCVGGKSVYWGGWCPRLTPADLARWPAPVAGYLNAHYTDVESETGVSPGTDFIFGGLHDALDAAVRAAAVGLPLVDTTVGAGGVQEAPLAVQGSSPVSGLFSFDKYSSLPLLVDALRQDIDASGNDARRRMFLVPRAHVVQLHAAGGTVRAVEVDVAGSRRLLPIAPECAVILSASAVESTRLALNSFRSPLMGRNLMAHVRSDFTVRIARAALPPLPGPVQTTALLVRGNAPTGRFHLQLTAGTGRGGADGLLFRLVPDLDLLDAHLANTDPDYVTLTMRCVGEMTGNPAAPVPNADGSWIDLSPFERDEYGAPRAYVQLKPAPGDLATWEAMDRTAIALAQRIAGGPAHIQYLYDGGWQSEPFPLSRPFPEWHRGLGTTYHEAGTLWMGEDPATSVTDVHGRFHHLTNAYACDQSLFPTAGSANPVLTGLTLARRLAEHLAA